MYYNTSYYKLKTPKEIKERRDKVDKFLERYSYNSNPILDEDESNTFIEKMLIGKISKNKTNQSKIKEILKQITRKL